MAQHSRFCRDTALTDAQFKRMYSAWLDNSISGEAAAEKIFNISCENPDPMMAGEDQLTETISGTGAITGFITVLLSSDKSAASITSLALIHPTTTRGWDRR